MNLYKALFGCSVAESKGVASSASRELLPQVHGFVDVALRGKKERESVPVHELGKGTFATRLLAGLRVGDSADFLYTTTAGRFRFVTTCVALEATQAQFSLPATIKTLADFAAKRSAVRLDSMLAVTWRYAPGGIGNGPFVKASLTDLSRNGASLVVARDLKKDAQVEVRITLKSSPEPLVLLSQVMRAAKIESFNKNSTDRNTAGIRFLSVDAAAERAIDRYIVGRQADRRDRGIV